MRKLYYMNLEQYNARYTLQLTDWNERVFKRRGIDYVIVSGESLTTDQQIVTGQVLDAHGRSYYSMSQIMNLVKLMKEGKVSNQDVVYFEDMFTPGFESIPYIINQVPVEHRPRIFVRCLAQSIDPDDFVHVWGMQKWMGYYEKLVCETVKFSNGAILATNEEMVAHMRIAGWDASIYNISGLAFGKEEVRERINSIKPFDKRKKRVVFSARWDREKNPNFYMDVIEEFHNRFGNEVEFCVCSGQLLKSNDASYMDRTEKLVKENKLTLYSNLQKNEYYNILNDSRVVFNCALQDWVSNTVSEADALECNVLFPAYRSFPETFANDSERMYVPWSINDAINKLVKLLEKPHTNIGKISKYNDGTIDRICDIIEGYGEKYNRNSNDYRKHVTEYKY